MFRVKVSYIGNDGQEYEKTYSNRQIHSCVRRTRREKNFSRLLGTTSWEPKVGEVTPHPPADYTPARFKVKKGRFGRMIAGQWIGEKDV